MNKKEKIKKYRESVQVEANEEKIQETIYKSKNVFFMAEQERTTTVPPSTHWAGRCWSCRSWHSRVRLAIPQTKDYNKG